MGQGSWLSLKALCGPVTLVPASSPHSIFLPPEVLSPLLMLFLLFGMPFLFFLLTVCSLCLVQFKCQLTRLYPCLPQVWMITSSSEYPLPCGLRTDDDNDLYGYVIFLLSQGPSSKRDLRLSSLPTPGLHRCPGHGC